MGRASGPHAPCSALHIVPEVGSSENRAYLNRCLCHEGGRGRRVNRTAQVRLGSAGGDGGVGMTAASAVREENVAWGSWGRGGGGHEGSCSPPSKQAGSSSLRREGRGCPPRYKTHGGGCVGLHGGGCVGLPRAACPQPQFKLQCALARNAGDGNARARARCGGRMRRARSEGRHPRVGRPADVCETHGGGCGGLRAARPQPQFKLQCALARNAGTAGSRHSRGRDPRRGVAPRGKGGGDGG